MISFEVPGLPRGQPRMRIGHVGNFARAYKSKDAIEAETTFRALATPYAPPTPYKGPIALEVMCWFPIPATWPNWRKAAASGGFVYPTMRPDADNCAKLVKDALTDVFWVDDKQVVNLTVKKRYTTGQPRTGVELHELTEARRGLIKHDA